jgi:ATP-binding cassette subfamily B protein RaxB
MEPSQWVLRGAAALRKKTPMMRQSEAAECGMACLAMIAGRYGHRMDLAALRRQYDLSLKGMTLNDLISLASKLGLATRALRAEPPHLRRLRKPCVLHWDHNHFVVLVRVGARSVTVHDPAVGRRQVPNAELSKRFTGIVLEAWPTQSFAPKIERARVRISSLLRRTTGFVRSTLQIVTMSLFLEMITIAIPIGFQLVVDDVVVSDDRNLLTLVVLGFGLLVGFRALVDFVRSWAIMIVGSSLTLQWKVSLFNHLLRLPLTFFERRHVGDLASRFTSIDVIQRTLSMASVSGLVDGIMAGALVAMMWLYNSWLAVLALAVTAVYAIVWALAYQFYRRANEEAIICAAHENSHFIETLRGMPSIKALAMGERRQISWNNLLVERVGAELRIQKLDLGFRTISTILFGLDRILIIFFGAQAVMSGSLTVGMLVAFIAYKDQFSQRVGTFLDTTVKIGMLSVHGERIADIALAQPEQVGSGRNFPVITPRLAPAPVKAALSARDINFRYGDNEPEIISGFNVDVRQSECIAIAGPSGAGKTTLLKILAGLLRPQSGVVLLDGVALQALGLDAYRKQIGCVLQDDRLFAGSIAENIAGFSPALDLVRVQQAAMLAAIHDEILQMPMGYESLVGDMGSSLSGGQMQRIVLARALYRQPSILLLDEATSHLDEENEKAINEAIRSLTMARVIVAHRRSTLEMADRVVRIWPVTTNAMEEAG